MGWLRDFWFFKTSPIDGAFICCWFFMVANMFIVLFWLLFTSSNDLNLCCSFVKDCCCNSLCFKVSLYKISALSRWSLLLFSAKLTSCFLGFNSSLVFFSFSRLLLISSLDFPIPWGLGLSIVWLLYLVCIVLLESNTWFIELLSRFFFPISIGFKGIDSFTFLLSSFDFINLLFKIGSNRLITFLFIRYT